MPQLLLGRGSLHAAVQSQCLMSCSVALGIGTMLWLLGRWAGSLPMETITKGNIGWMLCGSLPGRMRGRQRLERMEVGCLWVRELTAGV